MKGWPVRTVSSPYLDRVRPAPCLLGEPFYGDGDLIQQKSDDRNLEPHTRTLSDVLAHGYEQFATKTYAFRLYGYTCVLQGSWVG